MRGVCARRLRSTTPIAFALVNYDDVGVGIWGEIDAVRNEWDDYRDECADWRFVPDATARAKVADIAMKHISTGKLTRLPGKLARLPKKLRKDLQKGSWLTRVP